jgi:hypothetical protein
MLEPLVVILEARKPACPDLSRTKLRDLSRLVPSGSRGTCPERESRDLSRFIPNEAEGKHLGYGVASRLIV